MNRPWHRPCPSSAMVNRQASSASASWRCRALSSCASAISGATTSRTWCASRRSATGSCSAARPIRWASAWRRCSTGSASTPFTITTACSSETVAGGHRVPDRLVVVVQGVARERGGAWRRVWSAGWLLAHQAAVSAAPWLAPRSRWSAWWATRSSSSVSRCRNAVTEARVSASSVSLIDHSRGSPSWSRSAWNRATRAATGCASGSPNTVAIQGILASATDSPGPGTRTKFRDVDKYFEVFLERWMLWSRHSLAGARCSTTGQLQRILNQRHTRAEEHRSVAGPCDRRPRTTARRGLAPSPPGPPPATT